MRPGVAVGTSASPRKEHVSHDPAASTVRERFRRDTILPSASVRCGSVVRPLLPWRGGADGGVMRRILVPGALSRLAGRRIGGLVVFVGALAGYVALARCGY